jgi:uncharacterized protein (DUF2345 family)
MALIGGGTVTMFADRSFGLRMVARHRGAVAVQAQFDDHR